MDTVKDWLVAAATITFSPEIYVPKKPSMMTTSPHMLIVSSLSIGETRNTRILQWNKQPEGVT